MNLRGRWRLLVLMLGIATLTWLLAAPAQAKLPGLAEDLVRSMLLLQGQLHQELARLVRALRGENGASAVLMLMGVSLLYGVFHAAGPGHGKAVIASYLLASRARVREGVLLSVLASMAQAVTAIAVVGLLGVVFEWTRAGINTQVRLIEQVSYLAIAALGLWMLLAVFRGGHAGCAHDHAHAGHLDDLAQGKVAGPWQKAAMVSAIGLRPCAGAILVLLFSLAQGVFVVGALATVAMAAGTAMTVAGLALFTVLGRDMGLRLVGRGSSHAVWVARGIGVVGSVAVIGLGLLMFVGSLSTPASPL